VGNSSGDELVSEETLARLLTEPSTLRVHFQPVIGFDTGAVIAAEALLRARLDGVDISPLCVIGAAVEHGRIREVARHVLDVACREAHRWQAEGERPIALMFNVDANELTDPLLVGDVADALDRHQLPTDLLWMELTETALIAESPVVSENLSALRALGVMLSLDDFGTGYASLSHLRTVPLTAVKLDRQFIAGVVTPGADHEIVRSVIRLAHALGLRTIAEGVETERQRDALESLGCDAWQGFLRAPALEPDVFFDQVLAGRRQPTIAPTPRAPVSGDTAPDSFVLRRIGVGRWAHLGGSGRGEGWAGIVDVDETDTPLLAETLTNGITRVTYGQHRWLFGAYHAATAVAVPVDADTVVIFGAPNVVQMPQLPDDHWTQQAERLAAQITAVSPAKRLADELELSEALHTLVSNAATTLDEAMRHVVESVAGALSCEFAVIYLRASGRHAFANSTIHDVDHEELLRSLDELSDATTHPRCLQDAAKDPFPIPLPTDFGVRSWMAIPTAPELDGLIVCAHTDRGPRGFTSLCQRLGARLADAAELVLHAAIERERLHTEVHEASTMASRDALTGVLNRRGWAAAIDLVDPREDVSVLIVDINDLKLVNDRDGHVAGDRLLVTTARCLSSIVRATDAVARIGGDEFGVLMRGADQHVIRRVEGELRNIVQIEAIDDPNLSLAHGAASRADGETAYDLIALADERMYRMKRTMKALTSTRRRFNDDLIG
jgi:diguanylate cyclase (GGDEF)-like protein